MSDIEFRQGDLFRWSYKDESDKFMPYHCCARIAEFVDGTLYDIFWHNFRDGRQWTPEDAVAKLELIYLGNRTDLIPASPSAHKYYNPEDLVDLRHSNSMTEKVYIKKGAKRSPEVMAAHLHHVIDRSEIEIDLAKSRMKRAIDQLAQIESGDLPEYLECDGWPS